MPPLPTGKIQYLPLTKIMNRAEITQYLTNPELVANASSSDLRHLVEIYPYCESLHWLYLRSLYINDDAIFEDELMKYGMHISNRRLFYNYLTTNETTTDNEQTNIKTKNTTNSPLLIPHLSPPDYFTLQQNPEQKQSLQQLAAQLKAARLARQEKEKENTQSTSTTDIPNKQHTPKHPANIKTRTQTTTHTLQPTEENAKKLIREQKYSEAIEILRAISLNNPKKSANFALQIKFLETIINNHNKK